MIKARIKESSQDPLKKVISIEVADEGIGIPTEDLANLLTPFFRSKNDKSREKNPNGNGLGLSICHNIAKSLEGDLTCTSTYGLGSIFTFSFLTDFSKPEIISQPK
jgi:signal transduction histidine kinase